MNIQKGNVVPFRELEGPGIQQARVAAVTDDAVEIQIDGLHQTARLAFSCLVRPQADDRVLCARDADGAYFILAIIERPGAQHMTLGFPADVTLEAENGAVRMMTGESMTLAAADRITCLSDRVVHRGREAVIAYDEITAKGTRVQAAFKTISVISDLVNTMARQLIERVKNYVRRTEDYDQVNAGQMTRKVDGLYAMDSKHTVMVSKKDTKIDGERIHMG